MNATGYISLARNYSIVLIVALYLGLDGTQLHLRRVGLLADTREAFATQYLADRSHSRGELGSDWTDEVTGIGAIEVRFSDRPRGVGREEITWFGNRQTEITGASVSVVREDGQKWGVWIASSHITNTPSTHFTGTNLEQSVSSPISTLRGAYQSIWRDTPSGNDYESWFSKIEYELVEQAVPVPGLDMKFKSHLAPWIFSLLSLGLLIQIRNQVRRVLLDPKLAIDEPWLILDGQRGLERALALIWLGCLGAAPWVSNGCLVAIQAARVMAHGAGNGFTDHWLPIAASFGLLLAGSWTSLTVMAELLRLRRLRLQRLNALKTELEQAGTPEPVH